MDPSKDTELSPAERVFAAFLEEREDGGTDFEEFCRLHPAEADELRRIRAGFRKVDALLDPGGTSRPSEAPRPPEHERYEALDEVAHGGMGAVFRVRDRRLQREVAMKVLRTSGEVDPRVVARFHEEAQVTSQLEHPSIVPIYDIGELADGRTFYTMPLVRGRDLGELVPLAAEERDGWSRTRVLGVLLRVCEAVGAAHERGVVHRDLKPANVMVGAHGEVYVMDWGLARLLAESPEEGSETERPHSSRRARLDADPRASIGTVDGQVLGTPSYMSPEQARGELDAVGPASDVYSAGAMLYEVLTGKPPYVGRDERPDTRTVLERVLSGPPAKLSAVPGVPAELAAICDRAMERDVSRRYVAMGALADDLRAFLERRVVSAYRTGAMATLIMWVHRNRLLAATAALLVVALGSGLVVTSWLMARYDDQAARATAHFDAALEAVDRLLTEVGSGDLADVPGAQASRQRLLEEAVAFYERFLETEQDDREGRLRVARAHGRLAAAYGALDANEESIQATDRGLSELRKLQEASAGDRELARIVALETFSRATTHYTARAFESALVDVMEASSEVEELLAADPSDTVLARKLVAMSSLRANALYQLGDDTAESWFKSAIADCEELLVDERFAEDRASLESVLAEALAGLGVFYSEGGRLDEARDCLVRGIELRDAALRLDPGSRARRRRLAFALLNVIPVHGRLDPGGPDAMSAAERGIDMCNELVRDYPSIPEYLHLLAMFHSNLCLVRFDGGDTEGAMGAAESAVEYGRRVVERAPEERMKRALSNAYQNLFYIYGEAGLHREIAARVHEVPAVEPDRPVPFWRVSATALAYCADNALADEALTEDERERLRDEYVLEMVRYFLEMADRGYVDPVYLEESYFDGVRKHPEVEALLDVLSEGGA